MTQLHKDRQSLRRWLQGTAMSGLLAVAGLLSLAMPGTANAQVAGTCRLAEPNSLGQHVSEICWFQFGTTGEMLNSGTTRDYDFELPDGSHVTLTIAVTGGTYTPVAQRGLQVTQAPTWTGSNFSGNSNYYKIETPNSAALYPAVNGGANYVTMTVSSIRLFRPNGTEVTDVPFEIVFADAERLNSNPEYLDFGVVTGGNAFQVLEWLGPGGAGYNVESGTPGTIAPLITSPCWSGGASGAKTGVDCRRYRGTANGVDASAVVLTTQRDITSSQPFTVTGQVYSSGMQGFAIGVRWGSLRLRKQLPNGRVQASDQFNFQIANAAGTVVAQDVTTGTGTTSDWISTTAMPGNIFTLTESMASGSASVLGQYSSWVRCVGGVQGGGTTTTIIDQAYSPSNPPQINLDATISEPGYNIDCEFINTPAEFDLEVQKALTLVNGAALPSGGKVAPGDKLTYTITIENNDTVQAILPVGAVVESLPDGTTLDATTVDFTCFLNSCSNVNALTIAPGASATLTFVVNVDNPLSTSITEIKNNVVVTGVDCTATGNTCSHEVPVSRDVDLSIIKTNGMDTVTPGAQITYTVTVNNAGPAAANGAVVSDTPTSGLSNCAVTACASGNGASCPASGDWASLLTGGVAIPALPNTGSVMFSVGCTVTP
ncbi:MAG: hypothetical protein QM612_04560 [Thermomonas sp.]|uniref:hypothetical protein n=1 Tax=Thermomonas sp. TaxID=1971895 RepID=UPI0039E35A80